MFLTQPTTHTPAPLPDVARRHVVARAIVTPLVRRRCTRQPPRVAARHDHLDPGWVPPWPSRCPDTYLRQLQDMQSASSRGRSPGRRRARRPAPRPPRAHRVSRPGRSSPARRVADPGGGLLAYRRRLRGDLAAMARSRSSASVSGVGRAGAGWQDAGGKHRGPVVAYPLQHGGQPELDGLRHALGLSAGDDVPWRPGARGAAHRGAGDLQPVGPPVLVAVAAGGTMTSRWRSASRARRTRSGALLRRT